MSPVVVVASKYTVSEPLLDQDKVLLPYYVAYQPEEWQVTSVVSVPVVLQVSQLDYAHIDHYHN